MLPRRAPLAHSKILGVMRAFAKYTGAWTGAIVGALAGLALAKSKSKTKAMTDRFEPRDLRAQADAKLKARESSSGKSFFRKTPRSVTDIDSVVVHQMGFQRGSDPTRYLGVPAHYIIMPDGGVAQLHDWERYLYTSNGLNSRSIGVEIAGNFPNVNGTWWQPEKFGMDRPTPEQIKSLISLLRYVKLELEEQGSDLKAVFAHRQSSGAKANDPGPDVWRGIYPVFSELGLEDTRNFSVGTGKPILREWIPGGVA